jgi:hypothetical protein
VRSSTEIKIIYNYNWYCLMGPWTMLSIS